MSETWKETSQYTSLDTSSAEKGFNVTYGQDTLNVFTHFFDPSPPTEFRIPNHPLTVLSDATDVPDIFFNSGSFGLGPSSTAMKQLIADGRINRNVVSMYLGTAYPRAGGTQNGSIVLGGYDSGRFVGRPHKYNFGSAAPLKVSVKQLALVTADGTSVPLITDDGFDGYISTDQYPMELPQNILQTLSAAIGASPANNAENTLVANQPFNGNLTFTLEDGYNITFPSAWITNASNITPFSASPLKNTTSGPLIFGAAFLHHLYMTIDYDASAFYLADAKAYDNYVQPASLCTSQIPLAAVTPNLSKFLQSGLIGAIVGGIIGGSAIFCVLFYCIRKRAQRKLYGSDNDKMEGGGKVTRKSSLRHRSTFSISKIMGKTKPRKDVTFGNVKRVSLTDSESDSLPIKKTNVTVVSKDLYELNRIQGAQQGYQQSPLQTPYTATTPRTGNPLLGGPKQYAQFNDRDDSDIPANYRHERQASDPSRNKMGLKLNTGMQNSGLNGSFISAQKPQSNIRTKVDGPKLSPPAGHFLRKIFPST